MNRYRAKQINYSDGTKKVIFQYRLGPFWIDMDVMIAMYFPDTGIAIVEIDKSRKFIGDYSQEEIENILKWLESDRRHSILEEKHGMILFGIPLPSKQWTWKVTPYIDKAYEMDEIYKTPSVISTTLYKYITKHNKLISKTKA